MITSVTKELLEKYLQGDCTPDEILEVNQWYDLFDNENDSADLLTLFEQNSIKSRLLKGIKTKIEAQKMEDKESKIFRSRNIRSIFQFFTATAALLFIVFGFFFLYKRVSKPVTSGQELIIVSNSTNLIQKRILPDSTIVWLYPKSFIKYPKKFARHLRKTEMGGEVFYEVKPDPKRPFIINGGGVITRVLGTSFLIKAWKNLPTEVSVLTGKVSVRKLDLKKQEVFLLAKQKAILSQTDHSLSKSDEKQVSAMRIWQKTSLLFDNSSIPEILKTLNTQFKININTTDPNILMYTLNADFSNQSLPEILEMLGKSLNVTYEINGDNVILKKTNNQLVTKSKPFANE